MKWITYLIIYVFFLNKEALKNAVDSPGLRLLNLRITLRMYCITDYFKINF